MLKYEGEYLNGKRNGKGKEYFENGKLKFESEYSNGERVRISKNCYENGILKFDNVCKKRIKTSKNKNRFNTDNRKILFKKENSKEKGTSRKEKKSIIELLFEDENLKQKNMTKIHSKVKYFSENKNRKVKKYSDNKTFKFEQDFSKKCLFDSKINSKKEINKK